jgi:hypothetical protein
MQTLLHLEPKPQMNWAIRDDRSDLASDIGPGYDQPIEDTRSLEDRT